MSDERVRVEVNRSGGFAGITRTASLDTESLDAAKAAELRRLVGVSRAASSPAAAGEPAARRGADRFQFEITVEHDGQTETVARAEPDLTPVEQQLVRWVLTGTEPEPS